eukprot:TRINITY_DN2945_c0_g1_i1.p1 TRINITY_DN2945_c0_g1~~TRINITY_DN2945_c0_g1_i1.p1  ORF type:complete len:474 (-),score=87.60 TRINITY_DN2945_c0_g1_i1:82-1503(-)
MRTDTRLERRIMQGLTYQVIWNLFLVALCFALGITTLFAHVGTNVSATEQFTTDVSLSTIPLGILVGSTALASIPSTMMMSSLGYKKAFFISALIGAVGAALNMLSLLGHGGFALFCISALPQGVTNSFVNHYRHLAAAEISPDNLKSYAISFTLFGGLLGALMGPQLSVWTVDLIPEHPYSATYIALTGVMLLMGFIILIIDVKPEGSAALERELEKKIDSKTVNTNVKTLRQARPLIEIMKQSDAFLSTFTSTCGYIVMATFMNAAILRMKDIGYSIEKYEFALQCHITGMFAPSLFTGYLIAKWGMKVIILVGFVLADIGAVLFYLTLSGDDKFALYWMGMGFVGIGWNFSFIGGTALLSGVYRDEEKFKVQACNDFFVFTGNTVATLVTGVFFGFAGWKAIVITMAVILISNIIYIVTNIVQDFSQTSSGNAPSSLTKSEEEDEEEDNRLLSDSRSSEQGVDSARDTPS